MQEEAILDRLLALYTREIARELHSLFGLLMPKKKILHTFTLFLTVS